jgi:hypothetical protein
VAEDALRSRGGPPLLRHDPGPVYRDIDNPNAALFHIHVEDLDRAMQWFRTDTFKEATKRATVVRRDFYLAQKQQPRQA